MLPCWRRAASRRLFEAASGQKQSFGDEDIGHCVL